MKWGLAQTGLQNRQEYHSTRRNRCSNMKRCGSDAVRSAMVTRRQVKGVGRSPMRCRVVDLAYGLGPSRPCSQGGEPTRYR
jgi:hypothetical protein